MTHMTVGLEGLECRNQIPSDDPIDLTAYIGGPCCGNDSSSLLVPLGDVLEVENTPKQHVIGRETPTMIRDGQNESNFDAVIQSRVQKESALHQVISSFPMAIRRPSVGGARS